MDFQHVTVAHLMISPDHASRPSVHTSDEALLKIGVDVPCECFRVNAQRNDQRVGQNTPVAVHPVLGSLRMLHHFTVHMPPAAARPAAPLAARFAGSADWIRHL